MSSVPVPKPPIKPSVFSTFTSKVQKLIPSNVKTVIEKNGAKIVKTVLKPVKSNIDRFAAAKPSLTPSSSSSADSGPVAQVWPLPCVFFLHLLRVGQFYSSYREETCVAETVEYKMDWRGSNNSAVRADAIRLTCHLYPSQWWHKVPQRKKINKMDTIFPPTPHKSMWLATKEKRFLKMYKNAQKCSK